MFLQDDFVVKVGMKVKSKYYHNKTAPYRCASFKGHYYDAILESIGEHGTFSVKYDDSDSIETEVAFDSLKFQVQV